MKYIFSNFVYSTGTVSSSTPTIMSTRRRIGVSVATTEAARRALIKPVPCWKKQWVVADGASIKVCKWVKTDAIPVSFFKYHSSGVNTDVPCLSNSVMMRMMRLMYHLRPSLMNKKATLKPRRTCKKH